MPTSELLVRLLIPTVLVVSVVGLRIAFGWEKRRPSVPEHVARMRSWRSLPRREQRKHDDAVLDAAERAETGTLRTPRERLREYPDVRIGAEEAARCTASRMAEAAQRNALFHP
jgi:hypothetical protein